MLPDDPVLFSVVDAWIVVGDSAGKDKRSTVLHEVRDDVDRIFKIVFAWRHNQHIGVLGLELFEFVKIPKRDKILLLEIF